MEKPSKKVDLEFLRRIAATLGMRADVSLHVTDAEMNALPSGDLPDTHREPSEEDLAAGGRYIGRNRMLRVEGVTFFLLVWRQAGVPVERSPEPSSSPMPRSLEAVLEVRAKLGAERGRRRVGEFVRALAILQSMAVATWEATADAGREGAGVPMEELAELLGVDLGLPTAEWRERVRRALDGGRVTGEQAASAVLSRLWSSAGEQAGCLAEYRELAAAATLPPEVIGRIGGLGALLQPKAEA